MVKDSMGTFSGACILESLFMGISTSKILDFFLAFRDFDYAEVDIARRTKISERQISRALPILLELGLIFQTRISGRSKMYKLHPESKAVKGLIDFVFAVAEEKIDKIISKKARNRNLKNKPPLLS